MYFETSLIFFSPCLIFICSQFARLASGNYVQLLMRLASDDFDAEEQICDRLRVEGSYRNLGNGFIKSLYCGTYYFIHNKNLYEQKKFAL